MLATTVVMILRFFFMSSSFSLCTPCRVSEQHCPRYLRSGAPFTVRSCEGCALLAKERAGRYVHSTLWT
jgi:hypothetical protein